MIEVDQSGKVEQTGPTALAFSNDMQKAILIPPAVKRRAIEQLRRLGRKHQSTVNRVFAAGLVLLLRDVIAEGEPICIDCEYTGHQATIKNLILHYARRLGLQVDKESVTFGLIGKRSPAHSVAISVFRKKRSPDHLVTYEELWSLVG